MEFDLDKSQKQIQKAARDFAKKEFDKELIAEMEGKKEYPSEIQEKAAELGFIGMHYPESASGGDMGQLDNALLAEELCKKDCSMGIILMYSGFGAECILRFGNDEQKNKWLPKIAEGEMVSGAGFHETGFLTDLGAVKTTAAKNGDTWNITGEKPYVINGGKAGFYIVLARTDPGAEEEKALSLFLVEKDREGVIAEPYGDRMGLNMMPMAKMVFSEVSVPNENRIGEEGKGLEYALKFFDEHRIMIAAQAVGLAQGSLERAIEHIKGRVQFGKKLAEFQITKQKIAEMASKIQMARILTYEAAWNFDWKKATSSMCAMAKLAATRAAYEVTDEAIQLLGGYGYMTEYEVERFYRDAKLLELSDGNKLMLKDMIANDVIGKIK